MGGHGKSGSAAVKGITPSFTSAHLKFYAFFFKASKFTFLSSKQFIITSI
jgi:hypothetical protein